MLSSHARFYTSNGKRRLLVVDDEVVNRELLGLILGEHYDVLYAENGAQALEIIYQQHAMLSLVLLDLMMPEMDGFEVLKTLKADESLRRLPVMVLTGEKSAEVRSLDMGASDFITKPYEQPEVILARIQRTIELAEDRYIIQTTERDELTGLLNREFFYRYVDQFDLHHPDQPMDAVSMDINHFHLINELYGWEYGNKVLTQLGQELMRLATHSGSMAGRRDGDTFLLYCPRGTDYCKWRDALMRVLSESGNARSIYLRMGVYSGFDASLAPERRFDRAKVAADRIRGRYTEFLSRYDESLHHDEVLRERLIDDMDEAMRGGQFIVYYQPKYDIRGEKPVLSSAEALIRWRHPELGMISPGVFVPLFEENGLIQKLDSYVWRAAARQHRLWRDTFGLSIPISVNVSRIDIYSPELIPHLEALVKEFEIEPTQLYLEITESAYAKDGEQLIATVRKLREKGFFIEMDDFGSGYSSLGMLSDMPIDALKLDMQFIRNLDKNPHNLRLLEFLMDIARYLQVPAICEGVETQMQLDALKRVGCDLVQGYYFSRPVPPEEFEAFIKERIAQC